MKRVVMIGPPGSGKSTLSRRLGRALGIPVFHLDSLFWNPGWKSTPRDEFTQLQIQIMTENDSWIIDGDYASTLHVRLERCDSVVALDLARRIYLPRVLLRSVSSMLFKKERVDMAPGCPERPDAEFLAFVRYVWSYGTDRRPGVWALIDHVCDGKEVHRLTTPGQVEQFIRGIKRSPC